MHAKYLGHEDINNLKGLANNISNMNTVVSNGLTNLSNKILFYYLVTMLIMIDNA